MKIYKKAKNKGLMLYNVYVKMNASTTATVSLMFCIIGMMMMKYNMLSETFTV